jgi:hypothetical protein
MGPRTFTTSLLNHAALFALFFVAAAASFNGYYQKWHFAEADMPGDHSRASFESMVNGTAWRPYIYRQLLPTIANRIDQLTPQTIKHQLYERQTSGQNGGADSNSDPWLFAISASPTAQTEVYFFRYLVLYAATLAFTLAAVCAMYLACLAADTPPLAAAFTSIVVILLIPYFQSNGGFFYDYPELAFMALAVWFALRFDWRWLIPIAALAAWNKESFLLFIPTLYPILKRRHPRSALAATGLLCLVCAAVYLAVRTRFAHNPGAPAELWLPEQLRYFLHPSQFLFQSEETYGVRMVKAYTLIPMLLIAFTVHRSWRHLPTTIQQHAQIAAAINIPLYLVLSYPGELRDLSLLYITLLMAIAANVKLMLNPMSSSS